ncbi:hypothetical protein MMIC_P2346 [Mariprofundus micogutta]|uniref:RelA/SpoT domain-containing protein n=1 Tax=Mariprofundus micogutta TaxID=1921010 RepID=A0A1L8CR13_9PROT|nr:RelA/SpoT domain-containing protein [Mariprofundus micogutta]GAV21362.1 hypothetical protein MMIC_P2346 [Mariprofundus micogutta]
MESPTPEDKYNALSLEKDGGAAQSDLINFVAQSNLSELCYAYKSRVKSEVKLIEKKQRKRLEGKENYEISDITDVVGLRLVTLFRSEMVEVVEQVVRNILHLDGASHNPFIQSCPEEVIFYSVSYPKDEIAIAIKERIIPLFSGEGVPVKIKYSTEGYSSIHIVTRLNVSVESLSTSEERYFIPVEIQVRTVFEDAWGEIDHRYGYVNRAGKEVDIPVNNPEYVLPHLKVLKQFADACSQYADIIHFEATSQGNGGDSGLIISVDSDAEILDRFRALNTPQKLIDKYENYRLEKIGAQKIFDNKWGQGVSKLLSAAQLFRGLAEKVMTDIESPRTPLSLWLLYYYSKMNEAICLLSTGIKDEEIAAANVYNELEAEYEGFPLLRMRQGQVQGKFGDVDGAIKRLKGSKEEAETIQKGLVNGKWPDELPEVDYKHMIKVLPRLIGFQLWRKADSICETENLPLKLDLLREAFEETEIILSSEHADEREMRFAHNNLLCYGVEYIKLQPESEDTFLTILKEKMPQYLQALEEKTNLETCDKIELLDTFVSAYTFLGRGEDAKKVAAMILEISLKDGQEKGSPHNSQARLDLVKKAFTILNPDV